MTVFDVNKLEQFALINPEKLSSELVEKLQTFAIKYILHYSKSVEINSFISLCEMNLFDANADDLKLYEEKIAALDILKGELEQLNLEIYTALSKIYN